MIATLLWKEARDQRLTLLRLGLLLPLAFLFLALAHDRHLLRIMDLPSAAALVGAGICLLTVGTSIFSGEWSAGTAPLLQRTPYGLGRSFAAKCIFLWISGMVLAFWSGLIASNLQIFLRPTSHEFWLLWREAIEQRPLMYATWACWFVAVAAWGLRAEFTVVGGPIIVGLLTLPMAMGQFGWFALQSTPSLGAHTLWVISLVGALLSAWFAFTHVRSQRPRRAIGIACGIALLANSPAWTISAWSLVQSSRVIPTEPSCYFNSVILGKGGNFAYVSAFNRKYIAPDRQFQLDLRDGSWTEWKLAEDEGETTLTQTLQPHFPHVDSIILRTSKRQFVSSPARNAETGEMISGSFFEDWLFERRSEMEFPVEGRWNRASTLELGLGYLWSVGWEESGGKHCNERWVYDEPRGVFESIEDFEYDVRYVLPHCWLVKEPGRYSNPWMQWDPATRETSADPELHPADRILGCLPSGVLVAVRQGTPFLYDPSGKGHIELSGTAPTGANPGSWALLKNLEVPNGTDPLHLLRCWKPTSGTGFEWVTVGVLNPKERSIHWLKLPGNWGVPIGSTHPHCATFAVDRNTLIRRNLLTGKQIQLFPKPAEITHE